MATAIERTLTIRKPALQDGAAIWRLAGETQVLDANSPYAYLMMCDMFPDTCAVAFRNDRLAGFVTGYRKPDQADTFFVWQIGVHPAQQGTGIGKRLILHVLEREALRDVRFVEATIGPGNRASRQLFQRLAANLGADYRVAEHYEQALFPQESIHESELLYRIGPIRDSFPLSTESIR